MLKKLLGAILAIAMVLSLFPATVSAADEVDKSNLKLTYAIVGSSGSEYYTNVVNGKYEGTAVDTRVDLNNAMFKDYCATNGMWRFVGVHPDAANVNAYKTGGKTSSAQWSIYSKIGKWVAIGFHVPVAGKYNVTVTTPQYTEDTRCRFAFKILPGDSSTADITASMSDVVWNSEDKTAGSAHGWLYPYKSATDKTLTSTYENLEFSTPGEYLLVVQNIAHPGTTMDATATSSTDNIWISKFELVTSNGTGEAEAPLGYTMLDDTSIGVGEDTTASISTLYGSVNFGVYNPTAITYTSSDTSVATVDDNGTVTAKKAGEAEISAVVDGATLVSAPLTVTERNLGIVYDIAYKTGAAYFTDVVTANEFYGQKNSGTQKYLNTFADYSVTNGMWRFAEIDPDESNYTYGLGGLTYYGSWRFYSQVGNWVALGLHVPVAGTYDLGIEFTARTNHCRMAYKLFPGGTTADKISESMSDVVWDSSAQSAGSALGVADCNGTEGTAISKNHLDIPFENAGEYILVFQNVALADGVGASSSTNIAEINKITLTSGEGTGNVPVGYTKLTAGEITIDGTTTAETSALYGSADWEKYDATGATVTYASSNPNVAMVNTTTGAITAKALGTAEITATVDGAQLAPATITVADQRATDEVEEVSFMATSTLNGDGIEVTVTNKDYTIGAVDSSIVPGTTVKVTANPVDGYIFRGWKRGSKDNGVWLTTSSTYSFPLLTNTYLTAIYDVDTATDADVNVEFYNYNGQFLASNAVNGEGFSALASGVTPTLTGYNSYFWTIDGDTAIAADKVFEKLTRVVAKFNDEDRETFNVTVPTNAESNLPDGTYAYDTEITMTAADEGLWKVNGEPVAYGNSYTYCVWSEATITFEVKENDNKPIISIDDKTTDGARMISYDANGKNIVEVGILFGANATIANAESRAVSRARGTEACGQFTAKAYDETPIARAYLIYNDNGIYRVIYAD